MDSHILISIMFREVLQGVLSIQSVGLGLDWDNFWLERFPDTSQIKVL